MMTDAPSGLERLAATDPTVAPLARLQAIALREADDPVWSQGIPELPDSQADDGAPRLQGVTLQVDRDRARRLLCTLATTLDQTLGAADGRLGTAVTSADLDPLWLLRASVVQASADVEAIAARLDVDAAALAVVAHAATLPLLIACGRRSSGEVRAGGWSHGYCPLCAAWPALAEVRGLARDLILRCGRCGHGWPFEHRRCPFCDGREEDMQRYFAAESERESRRAVTCDRCRGYVKTQTTLGPLDLADVLVRDLESLDLDMAVLDHDYGRPETPGWSLTLQIEPLPGRGRGRELLGRWWR